MAITLRLSSKKTVKEVSTVEDLIGLPAEDFNEALAARSVGLESFDKKKGRKLYGE